MNKIRFRRINKIKNIIPGVKFFNTICRPTSLKQSEIKNMPLQNSLMLVIGSKNSANTKRLYQLSLEINPHTYWVNTPGEIKRIWFDKAKSVGITAGASTPQSTIKAIIEKIKKMQE